jgi:HlyD family secretion protein
MSPKKVLPILVLAGAATAVVVYQFGWARSAGDPDSLRLSGNIEVIDAQVSFKIAGRVDARPVDEGYTLEQGQLVAVLDTSDLKHDVALRQAEVQAAEAALAELLAGSRPQEITAAEAAMHKAAAFVEELEHGSRPQEIAVAEAVVRSALAEKNRLEDELARATRLRKQNANSVEDLVRAQAAFDVAVALHRQAQERLALAKEGPRLEQIAQARAALAQAKAQYELVKIGPRSEDIDQARARLGQTKASLGLARTRFDYATLKAPMSGVVLSKNIEPGEYVNPGTPVITMANLKDVWLRAYVDARQVGRLRIGQSARVTTDTPGQAFTGRVSFISSEAEFTPKTVQTEQERVKLVYRVKIDIPNPDGALKPGMPADAQIQLAAATSQASAERRP